MKNWQLPLKSVIIEDFSEIVNNIPSPYEQKIPPFCYPGTILDTKVMTGINSLIAKQINSIGSHTHLTKSDLGIHGFRKSEGGFETIQRMEAEVIWMLASMIGGSPETVDGYFCGGGTEANIEGMWIGREYLKKFPDPNDKGIVVLTSSLRHYSIDKAVQLLEIGNSELINCKECNQSHIFVPDKSGSGLNLVGTNKKGEMDVNELKKVFSHKYQEGFRRFLVAPTVGTCLLGSIDPIKEIGEFISSATSETDANFYMHVDASFAGFTVPFVNPTLEIGFTVPELMSITVDADKMGRLPYPAGIFLCRKDLMSSVARKVNYVRGNQDDTVSGSRSCISAVLGWYLYQKEGVEGQRKYVQECLQMRDFLVKEILNNASWIKVLHCSPDVNFAPLEIDIEDGKIPEELKDKELFPYHMRSDFLPGNISDIQSCPRVIYKVCIMPHHTKQHIQEFVKALNNAKAKYSR